MTFDGVLLAGIGRLAISLLAALLGLVVLLRGRRLTWLFSGAASFLLGLVLVAVVDSLLGGRLSDAEGLSWSELIPVAAAVLGALVGRFQKTLAYSIIGLATGGVLALWVAKMLLPEGTVLDFWSGMVVVLVMGVGMLFVLRYHKVSLILLSVATGVSLIIYGLKLPLNSEFVAALTLAAAIAGLVIQYHDFLIESRAEQREAETMVTLVQAPATGGDGAGPLALR
jgi:MFS family permease